MYKEYTDAEIVAAFKEATRHIPNSPLVGDIERALEFQLTTLAALGRVFIKQLKLEK